MNKRLAFALAILFINAPAFAEPVQVAAFETSLTPSASIKNVISASLVQDKEYGVELSYERSLSRHWALRSFAEASNRGYYTNSLAHRVGGGLGLRAYWLSAQPLAGLFVDTHAVAFNVFDPGMGSYYGGNFLDPLIHTMYGGGLTGGWAIPLADHVRLTPAYRVDWLFSDQEKAISGGGGRIYADFLINLGVAF